MSTTLKFVPPANPPKTVKEVSLYLTYNTDGSATLRGGDYSLVHIDPDGCLQLVQSVSPSLGLPLSRRQEVRVYANGALLNP